MSAAVSLTARVQPPTSVSVVGGFVNGLAAAGEPRLDDFIVDGKWANG
jgi:hypothetical protein